MTHAIVGDPAFASKRTRTLRTGLTLGTPEDVRLAAEVLAAPEICNVYGLSETYGNCCVTPCDWPLEERVSSQGPPLPGTTVRIVDPQTDAVVPAGSVGEVEVGGYVIPGYFGESSRFNTEKFTRDGFLRTGDLGMLDDAGRFHFMGRGDDMIRTSGINVSPIEIEELLLLHPGVVEAGVVGVPAPVKGQEIAAFVVRQSAFPSLEPDELKKHCRQHASAYKVPHHVLFCEALPTTATGKLSRAGLKDEWLARQATKTDADAEESAEPLQATRADAPITIEQRGS
jgi:fatty-acyl-CoA synthase